MKQLNHSEVFLKKALEDEILLKKLINDFDVSDTIWGFHAQQAIEKLLKALLIKNKTDFPRTHDLTVLFELLNGAGVELPFSINDLDILTPYAVLLRYEDFEGENIDRETVFKFIQKVRQWAEKLIRE